jgi:hypothetical protein
VHHRETIAEHVYSREATVIEDRRAAFGFEKPEPQQHDDMRNELERMFNELLSELVGRVGDDRFDPGRRRALEQKIDAARAVSATVVDEIGGNHVVARTAQHAHDRPRTTARFPNAKW